MASQEIRDLINESAKDDVVRDLMEQVIDGMTACALVEDDPAASGLAVAMDALVEMIARLHGPRKVCALLADALAEMDTTHQTATLLHQHGNDSLGWLLIRDQGHMAAADEVADYCNRAGYLVP